jgi:hypothetical protein
MSDSEDDYWGDEIEGAGEWKGEKKIDIVRKLGSEYRCTANRACFIPDVCKRKREEEDEDEFKKELHHETEKDEEDTNDTIFYRSSKKRLLSDTDSVDSVTILEQKRNSPLTITINSSVEAIGNAISLFTKNFFINLNFFNKVTLRVVAFI